jgi:hypothetical protein
MKDLVSVKSFSNRLEADVAKGKLESENIVSFVTADDEGGMIPFQLGKDGVQLFVKEEDLKKAQEILA